MKGRGLSFAAVIVAVTAPATAADIRVGGAAGVSLASVSAESDARLKFSSRGTFAGGAVIEVGLSRRIAVQLQPMLLGRGASAAGKNETFVSGQLVESTPVDGALRFRYFELPVRLKITAGGERVRPYALAGPSVGFLSRATAQLGDGEEEDVKDGMRGTDFGLTLGGGLELPRGRTSVFIEGSYAFGLRNLAKQAEPGDSLKNRGFQLKVGATIRLAR